MRTLAAAIVALVGCTPQATPGTPPPKAPPALGGDVSDTPAPPDAPLAGEHVCPDGAEALVEEQNPGQTLLSCVIPGREYRNTPFRHGPYLLVGAGNRVLMSGEWRDNQQEGVWRFWHPNGKIRRETTYRAGAAQADANWDDAGRKIDRRDGRGATVWYPNGNKQQEQSAGADGVTEERTWFENGNPAKQVRMLNGGWDGAQSEWFENGTKKEETTYGKGRIAAWQGWSSNGRELTDDTCVEDADCVSVAQNVCYACVPPYQAVTRWRQAQLRLHPPPPPTGCDPGPFGCAGLPSPPAATCKANRCALP